MYLATIRSRVAGMEKREGGIATRDDVSLLANGDCDIYKPNGEPLLFVRRKVYDQALLDEIRPIFGSRCYHASFVESWEVRGRCSSHEGFQGRNT